MDEDQQTLVDPSEPGTPGNDDDRHQVEPEAVATRKGQDVCLVLSPRAAFALYGHLRTSSTSEFNEEPITAIRDELMDQLGMRSAVEATKAAREVEAKARAAKKPWALPTPRRSGQHEGGGGTPPGVERLSGGRTIPKQKKVQAKPKAKKKAAVQQLDHVAAAVALAQNEKDRSER